MTADASRHCRDPGATLRLVRRVPRACCQPAARGL